MSSSEALRLARRALDHEEIRQLAARYARATDCRDLDVLVNLFVDNVRVGKDASGEWVVGRAALREFFAESLRAVRTTILHVTTHVIDFVDDAHATGIVYCRGEIEVDDQWVIQAIQYRDRYRRDRNGWRFVGRRHLLWYGADVLTRPIGLPPANWPEHHVGKGELPECDPTWHVFWED
jgi:ketosteroid isomerase-like protein